MRYFVGIDGGGTKTGVCVASIDAPSVQYAKTSGSSWREYPSMEIAHNLKESVDSLVKDKNGQLAGIAMGLPCYGESVKGDSLLEQAINEVFSGIPIYLTNDVEAGWAGSMALEPGINIVAGTGAVAFGKDIHGRTARVGGWSEFFGDEGSCYWVGRKVMQLFSKQADGRLPRDELYTTVRRKFKLQNDMNFIDIIHTDYIDSRKQVATLQFLAEEAALAGSSSAKAIYEEAAFELCLMVDALRQQLDFSGTVFNVSYSGGLFRAGDLVLPHFSEEIEKRGGKLVSPCFEPVEGAMLLAFQHFYPEGLSHIINLIQDKEAHH